VHITRGLEALAVETRNSALEQVRNFTAFTDEHDPFGEHDFGAVEVGGETFYFKMDYFDRPMVRASPDPSDPSKTTRVLTIMLSTELLTIAVSSRKTSWSRSLMIATRTRINKRATSV
jgi:hypothetical protein